MEMEAIDSRMWWEICRAPAWLLPRAQHYAGVAARELGIEAPEVFAFRRAAAPGEGAFVSDEAIAGISCLPGRPQAIGLLADGFRSEFHVAETASHEVFHTADPQQPEDAARAFGVSFAHRHTATRTGSPAAFLRTAAVVGELARMRGWSERELMAVLQRI